MPVRSLTSSVLRWPPREAVAEAARGWAAEVSTRNGVVKVGYFGSLARGHWGVGSDVDLVVIVQESSEPSYRRSLAFDASGSPFSRTWSCTRDRSGSASRAPGGSRSARSNASSLTEFD
jgi:hypothetical protein